MATLKTSETLRSIASANGINLDGARTAGDVRDRFGDRLHTDSGPDTPTAATCIEGLRVDEVALLPSSLTVSRRELLDVLASPSCMTSLANVLSVTIEAARKATSECVHPIETWEHPASMKGTRNVVAVVVDGVTTGAVSGSWGGPNPFVKNVVDGTAKGEFIPVTPTTIVMITREGERYSSRAVIHPSQYETIATAVLQRRGASHATVDDVKALRILWGYKPAYRPAEWTEAGFGKYGKDNAIVQSLTSRGLLKVSSAGAIGLTDKGRAVIGR